MIYPETPRRVNPLRSDRVAQHLRDRLLHYFETVCPEQHDIEIPVVSPSNPTEYRADCVLRFALPDPLAVEARFTIDHVGGNVFEVAGGLEGQPIERFSCCLSESPSEETLASIEESIGEFLLTEVQCLVGTHVLRHPERLAMIPA